VTRLKSKAATLEQQAEARGAARAPVLSTGEVGGLRAEARSALGAIGETLKPAGPAEDAQALDTAPAVGDRVFVPTFNAEGIVRGVAGRQIEVDIRGKRMRVPVQSLRKKAPGPGPQAPAPGQRPLGLSRSEGHRTQAPGLRAAAEIVLIGSTVDEAIDRVEKFLDDAMLGDERRLRVVHGHGTGRLREALRAHLRNHAAVAHVSPAADNEGGDGATIVELRE
jgi:DNA mismatch repair protein MutS2